MLRIEEIVGAMDDEFRYSLDALSDERLAQLMADKAALRRLRPIGVSNAEAQAMIAAIQKKRAEPVAPPAPRLRKPRPPRKVQPPIAPEITVAERPASDMVEPADVEAQSAPPAVEGPAQLPPPVEPALLTPPSAHGPAIRLGPPEQDGPVIELGPPAPPPAPPQPTLPQQQTRIALASPVAGRHALLLGALSLAVATALALL